jgi:hypothetical protein
MPDTELPDPKSRTGPKVLVVISVAVLLLGIGKCGSFAPAILGTNDDYGIGGAFFIVVGLILLIAGVVWLQRRSSE